MRILVYGAGVVGSLYAARLAESGNDVSILARGRRLQFLAENGIVMVNGYSESRSTQEITVVDHAAEDERWDLVVVAVRKNQLDSITPTLASIRAEALLLLGNNVTGHAELAERLGAERVLFGFPGFGGILDEDVVVFVDADEGSSTRWGAVIGELGGRASARQERVRAALVEAGIPTEACPGIVAWLVSQAGVTVPVAHALYLVEGGVYALAGRPDVLRLLIFAIRESLAVQEALGIPVTPNRLRMYRWVPSWVLNTMLRARFNSRMAEIGIQGHALAAQDEMEELAREHTALIRDSKLATPALRVLYNLGE